MEGLHETSKVSLASPLGQVAAHEWGTCCWARIRTRRAGSCERCGRVGNWPAPGKGRFFSQRANPGKEDQHPERSLASHGGASGRGSGSVFAGACDDGRARAFLKSVNGVGGKAAEFLEQAAGPADLETIDFDGGGEAKVDAHVIIGDVAGAAADFVNKSARASSDGDFRSDAIAIGFDADRTEGDPVIAVADVIDEQRRKSIHVADHRGNEAVVP